MLVDFGSLFERYSGDIYRFALYLSGDPSLADDICQETFVRAWVAPQRIREGTVKAYLLRIAKNLYSDELKRRARSGSLETDILDSRPGPPSIAADRSELASVLHALQTLREIDRAALLMSAQEGMSHAEIGAALDLSVAAVKVKIHRARMHLKQILAPEESRP